jgi:site-specific recombinase XerD
MAKISPPRTPAVPSYPTKAHKRGSARVKWRGHTYYLGKHGTPESRERYREFLDKVVLPNLRGGPPVEPASDLLIAQLGVEWLRHCRDYYAVDEYTHHRIAFMICAKMFGRERCIDFGPLKLEKVRNSMVGRGWKRQHVNAAIHKLRHAFRWAASRELIPISVYERLRSLEALGVGKTNAPESEPVESVPLGQVVAAECHMPRVVRDMVRLQWLTGMRPGELCSLTPEQIEIRDGAWYYRPDKHKTKYMGKKRVVLIGRLAKAVLRPYLDRPADLPCFSPKESRVQRGWHLTKCLRLNDAYKTASYRRAVSYACKRAGVDWSPNQLRHSRGQIVRERFGLDAAQVILGHTHAKTTEIYAKAALDAAEIVVATLG